MMQYRLQMPGKVYSGHDALMNLPEILCQNRVKRPVIITDKGIRRTGLVDFALSKIRDSSLSPAIFDDLAPEPTYGQVQVLVDDCRRVKADFIVALGGGSVMDTAKLTSILIDNEHTVKDLLESPVQVKKGCKTLMIPTTAGTGAEATPNAIVAVPEQELKVGIVNAEMIADYVILDAVMIKNLPRNIAAATGLDALTHAVECYTSNKANPFSDLFALQALDMIMNNIENACNEPNDMPAKENMLLASFYAGIAITTSGTTAVHALSYPLGGKYHIPHGVSNAILLVPVMRFNEPYCRNRLAEAYDRCCKDKAHLDSIEDKSAWMIRRMEQIVKQLDIPDNLREFGVTHDDLDTLVHAGMQVTRLLSNNMRPVTADDARAIYQQIL